MICLEIGQRKMKLKIIEYVMNWKIGSNRFCKVYNPLLSGVTPLETDIVFEDKKCILLVKMTKKYDYLKS